MKCSTRGGFTLVELLIAVTVVSILSTAVIFGLNPAQLLKQTRDSARLSDLAALNTALAVYSTDIPGAFMGTSSVIYVSIPDTSATCANLGLSALPPGYSYNCVSTSTLRKTDGTGWIPVNLGSASFGSPLAALPVDPVNTTSSGKFYAYIGGSWALSAVLESSKYTATMANDGGYSIYAYEVGTNLALAPMTLLTRAASSLAANSGTLSQTDDSTSTAGFNLAGSSFSSTLVTGTGAAASVKLATVATTFGGNWTEFGIFPGNPFTSSVQDIAVDSTNNKATVVTDIDRLWQFDSGSGGTTLGGNFQTAWNFGIAPPIGAYGIFTDVPNNKIFIANAQNPRIIRVDSGSGGTTYGANIQTFGTNGTSTNQFVGPMGVAVDTTHNKVFVADNGGYRIATFDSGGGGTTFGANWQSFGTNGTSTNQFQHLYGIAVDPVNNKVFVPDADNARVVRVDSGTGGTTFGANWQAFGTSGSGVNQFTGLRKISVDPSSNKVYATDASLNRLAQFDSGGGGTTFGANWQTAFSATCYYGSAPNCFNGILGVFADSNNKIYLTDPLSERVAKVDAGGTVYASTGTYTSGALDTGRAITSWGTVAWSNSAGQTITVKVRSSTNPSFTGATAWSSCASLTNGSPLFSGNCVSAGDRYVQYQATLSTASGAATPSLDSISFGYYY